MGKEARSAVFQRENCFLGKIEFAFLQRRKHGRVAYGG